MQHTCLLRKSYKYTNAHKMYACVMLSGDVDKITTGFLKVNYIVSFGQLVVM
jgi:hypothetical protein